MNTLYLEPDDLIILIAKDKPLNQEQIHFHISYYEGVSNLHKKSESYLSLAACSLLNSNLEASKLYLQRYFESPSPRLSYYSLLLHGLLYEKMGSHQSSIETYKQACNEVEETTKKPYLLFKHLIDCFYTTKNYSEANEFFLKVSVPKKIQTYIYAKLGYFCELLSLKENAIKWYLKISTLDSSVSRACYVWLNYLQGKDISSLVEFYRSIEPVNKTVLFDWDYLMTMNFISKNDLDKALETLKKISEIKKDSYFSLLGFIYYKKKRIIQAFLNYLKALQINPDKAENWYNLAVIYKKTGQVEFQETLAKARSLDSCLKFAEDSNNLSDVAIMHFDFSMFGKEPVLKTRKKSLEIQKKCEKENGNEICPKIIAPKVISNNATVPNAGMMPNMDLFYETMVKMWSNIFQRNPVDVMSGFGSLAYQSLSQNSEDRHRELPKKRGRKAKK